MTGASPKKGKYWQGRAKALCTPDAGTLSAQSTVLGRLPHLNALARLPTPEAVLRGVVLVHAEHRYTAVAAPSCPTLQVREQRLGECTRSEHTAAYFPTSMQQTWAVMAWLETDARLQQNKAELIKEQCALPHS
jgi:hypothetical protein